MSLPLHPGYDHRFRSHDARIRREGMNRAVPMPHIVQILLPVYDNAGRRFPPAAFAEVRAELAARFGGLTAWTRVPAEGLWDSETGIKHDDIVVFEVMVDALDRDWWRAYRQRLESEFRQQAV